VGGLNLRRKLSETGVGRCGGGEEGLDRRREPGSELPDEIGDDGSESDAARRNQRGAGLE
jgi:hypothetical protein